MRYGLDILMFVLLVGEMAFFYLPPLVHEAVGVAFLLPIGGRLVFGFDSLLLGLVYEMTRVLAALPVTDRPRMDSPSPWTEAVTCFQPVKSSGVTWRD